MAFMDAGFREEAAEAWVADALADAREARREAAREAGVCVGCGAAWVGHAGAFACGAPLADCGAQVDADEDWREADFEAAALEAFLVERAAA